MYLSRLYRTAGFFASRQQTLFFLLLWYKSCFISQSFSFLCLILFFKVSLWASLKNLLKREFLLFPMIVWDFCSWFKFLELRA